MRLLWMTTVAFTTAASIASAADTPKPSFDQTYGVVVQRNPFVRDRVKPRTTDDIKRDSDQRRRPPKTAAQSLILRGVTIEDQELHAYFEDTRSNSPQRVKPGDPLGDGRVADIAIDAVAFEQGGRTVWVEVGQNLTGSQGEVAAAGTPSGSPTTGPSASTGGSGSPPPPLPPGATLEERLKARRSQMRSGNK